jgi:hypothetical protein
MKPATCIDRSIREPDSFDFFEIKQPLTICQRVKRLDAQQWKSIT